MSGNTSQKSGSYFRGTRRDLDYFDMLPPTARRALADAAFDWSAGSVYNRWKKAKRGFKTGVAVAASIARWDKLQIAKDRKRVWGFK